MKAKSWIWLTVIGFFLIAGAIFMTDMDSGVLVATALGYTGVVSAWLGYDIMKTRDRTLSMPGASNGSAVKGVNFEQIALARYLFSLFSVGALLVITIVRDVGGFSPVKMALIPCVFGMGAAIVTAYGVNKNATPKGPKS